jgi:hypothetical protein
MSPGLVVLQVDANPLATVIPASLPCLVGRHVGGESEITALR